MKKSNKILLTYFLFAFLAITVVHVTLYAKYKRGEFVSFDKVREERMEEISLPNIKYVSVTGQQRCNILPATEPKMKMVKMPGSRIKYTIVNDTLIITGDSVITKLDMDDGRRGYQTVNLYLPGTPVISAVYSDVYLIGAKNTTSAQSYVINLESRSFLYAGDWNYKESFFHGIQVTAQSSNIRVDEAAKIDSLNLRSFNSTTENKSAYIKQLQLQLDKNSTILLQGGNLNDIKVVKE